MPESVNPDAAARVFSVGHSNLPVERFVLLLKVNQIDILVDVRSRPYSRWASQFNHDSLKGALEASAIQHLYLGQELGGRPDSAEFYDAAGHVLYGAIAESSLFQEGVKQLERLVPDHRIALMCSEEDPTSCHRRLLVGRVLRQRGIAMDHIRSHGQVQQEDELAPVKPEASSQLSLFGAQEVETWRSVKPIRSASPDTPPRSSSGP